MIGAYRYKYEWYTLGKDLSHIIIELAEGLENLTNIGFSDQKSGDDISKNYEIGSFSDTQEEDNPEDSQGNSNPGMPYEIYGIKVEPLSDTNSFGFWFTVDREPVWGNFYAKSGNGVYAYNTGFNSGDAFIARPDGAPVPEPATMLLLGVGLIGLAGIGRGRFRKSKT